MRFDEYQLYSLKAILSYLKPFALALLAVVLLRTTGLMGGLSYITQSAMLHSGLLDAEAATYEKKTDFDFNFTIKDLAGQKKSFEEYRGKVIFLNLWATWCGPCRAEMPTIQKLYDKIESDKIAFVMLSIDEDVNKNKVAKYISDRAFTFPVFMPSGYLSQQLVVPSIPTTFVISKDGKILTKEVGTANYDTEKFRKFLEAEAIK